MYKVNEVKSFLDCDVCYQLLVGPVLMACGEIICKTHLDKLMTNTSKRKDFFVCGICQEEHMVPKNGFVVNSRLQKLLDLELNALKGSPVFDECMKEINKAKENLVKCELLEKNAENYIYDYFEDIKRQVDLRREDLKLKIDTYSDEIIKSVEKDQMNYIKLSKEISIISANIEKSKEELNKSVLQFDTLEFNDEKFGNIKASVADVNLKFNKILTEYNDSLIDNKNFAFEFKELKIEDVFGRVTDCGVNIIYL
jgi:hypothetical protein